MTNENSPITTPPVRDFEKSLASFIVGCKAISEKTTQRTVNFETTDGPRYVKVIRLDQRSVHCFVEKSTGNVLKADGWTKPAKHARGNIYDQNNGLDSMGPYGAAYLR